MRLNVVTANTDWAKGRDGAYLRHLAETADVILTQEARDTDLGAVAVTLPRGPWQALQDTTDDAHKGTGILVRLAAAKVVSSRLVLGCNPFLPTGTRVKMLARYIHIAHLETADGATLPVVSAHFPPHRFSLLQPIFMRNLKTLLDNNPRAVVGVDANQPIEDVAKALGFTAHGEGIVGLLTGPKVKVADVVVSDWGVARELTDHPAVSADCAPFDPPKPAPAPYGKTTVRGHTLDNLTDYALLAVEKRLGYTPRSLTVVQGSYNAGGVGASAGTHDGGGAVDLTPAHWEDKVHALRAVGFAAWHRPALPGVWNEHIHAVLIGNDKLSGAAAAQVTDYRNHRDGLARHLADNTWHPDPIPVFRMPKFAAEV